MVAGSMIMAVWSGPKKKINAVLLSGTGLGAALVIAGPQQHPLWLAASFFLFAMCIPMGLSSAGADLAEQDRARPGRPRHRDDDHVRRSCAFQSPA